MSDNPPPLPSLTPTPRVDAAGLRRRSWVVGGVVGAVLLIGLLLATWLPTPAAQRPVVLSGSRGSRVAVDGDPQPSLGSDGTHLLQLRPGDHELVVTLRSGEEIASRVEVAEGEGSLLLELRFDRVAGRWKIVVVDAPGGSAEDSEG